MILDKQFIRSVIDPWNKYEDKDMYTKGPWGINWHKNIIYKDDPVDAIPIAVVSSGTVHGAYDISVIKANAKLIAAAPELLEALQNIKKHFEETSPKIYTLSAAWNIANRAIAKALPEPPK